MNIPSSIYIAIGAVLAAVVAGFFSFLNLVSSKENKVSEFRQAWIDGIREEIAAYTAGMQALIRFRNNEDKFESMIEYYKVTEQAYRTSSEALTKIQLRLNPEHAKNSPDSHEARLISAINTARENFNKKDFTTAFDGATDIRNAAALFLKNEWERVKNGEDGYQEIRKNAFRTIKSGIILLALLAIASLIFSIVNFTG